MMKNDDVEARLRALTAKSPPPELRERVLRRAGEQLASKGARPRSFLPKLALACSIIVLMLLDLSVERIQGARIARLTGTPATLARGEVQPAAALLASIYSRKMSWAGLMEGTGLP